jgi:Ni,Fe-hydrogenase maturation factor
MELFEEFMEEIKIEKQVIILVIENFLRDFNRTISNPTTQQIDSATERIHEGCRKYCNKAPK